MDDFFFPDTTTAGDTTTNNNHHRRQLYYSLQKPFNAIPRATWLKALRALTSNDISSTTTSTSKTSINSNSIKVLSSPAKVVSSELQQYTTPSNAAYRILQRLVKGWGVRTFASNKKRTEQQLALDERDFNMVLHSYARGLNNHHNHHHHHHRHSLRHIPTTSSTNDPIVNTNVGITNHKNNHRQQTMYKMHSLMALQERTPHAPPLSPVAYSILLKAYGAARDIKNVDMSLQHAQRNGVLPDIVMVNTVLDAYVNCGLVDRAQSLVREMKNGGGSITRRVRDGRRVQGVDGDRFNSSGDEEQGEVKSSFWSNLRPNSRTYNTLLKGFAETGDIRPAMKLSKTIEAQNLWDDITTNTLVKVAVTAGEFDLAQVVLSNHTSTFRVAEEKQGQVDHPNVEAYTELLDGYAKDGQLENALRVMQLMQQRGVHPNEYTYTCMVSALARNNKVRQARKMITYAASTLGSPANNNNSNNNNGSRRKRRRRISLTPTYNAFISGLLSNSESEGSSHAANIVEILGVIQEMQDSTSSTNNNNDSNVYIHAQPNVVTISLVVDGLGKCNPPRCAEARELVNHLEYSSRNNGDSGGSGGVSLSNKKIATTLIRAYGRANEFGSALEMYHRILPTPDVVAFNALLDACCKCDQLKMALELFGKHVNFKEWKEQQEESAMAIVPSGNNKSVAEKKKAIVIKPDVVTYTTLISALLQLNSRAATKRATALYNEMMQKWWISPDTVIVDT
jgi:pentatricopeptide repeat protein